MDIRSRSNPSECSPTKRGGKRSKEEEEGPLLHAPLPPKGVLRCLRSSGLTFSFSQFEFACAPILRFIFRKNFRKNILDFFREFILLGNSFLTRLRLPFCWPSFFGAIFSALSPGIHRLALVCIFAQRSSVRSCPLAFAPGPVVYVVAGHPPGWRAARPMILLRFLTFSSCFCVPPHVFAARVSGFAGGFVRRAFDNVFVFSLSRLR